MTLPTARTKFGAFALSAVVIAFSAASAPARAADGPKLEGRMETFQVAPGIRPRPETTWKDGNGKTVSLKDFDGKIVLVNFWATWCAPCVRELPSIDRLAARLDGEEFKVVAINIDRGGKPVARKMLRRLKLKNLDLYLDRENTAVRGLGVRQMPTTYVFDRKGREVGKLEGGAEWDEPEAVALVKYFIGNPKHGDNPPGG